jgi:threonine synthase
MPTNGNAGAAWATYAARHGMRSTVVMPVEAPRVTRVEAHLAGADLVLIDGLISDAGRAVGEYVARTGAFDASTLKEPYRVEGKKTMGYEIAEQLGWRCPDVIVYPTGGGVGLIGIYKALLELQELGWITDRLPRLVAVQSTGCAPIVRAFEAGARHADVWADAHTVAFGITVPQSIGDFLVLDAVRATNGTALAVDDADLLADQAACARVEGAFLCPEGAATLTAVRTLSESGWLASSDEVVILNTGAAIKYGDSVLVRAPTLPIDGTIPVRSQA